MAKRALALAQLWSSSQSETEEEGEATVRERFSLAQHPHAPSEVEPRIIDVVVFIVFAVVNVRIVTFAFASSCRLTASLARPTQSAATERQGLTRAPRV